MRKLFILLFLFPLSLSAQEKYFYELRGMEDSSGTTHLFYRIFESTKSSCSYIDVPSTPYTLIDNSIYQFNTESKEQKKRFDAGLGVTVDCTHWGSNIEKYIFTSLHPDSVITIKSGGGGLSLYNYLEFSKQNTFDLGLGNPNGFSIDHTNRTIILTTPIYELIVKRRSWEEKLGKSFSFTLGDSLWDYSYFRNIPDSLLIDFTVTGVNPFSEGIYVGIKDTSIVLSKDFGKTFSPIAKSPFDTWDLGEYLKIESSIFDKDSSSFYMVFKSNFIKTIFLLKKEASEWAVTELSAHSEDFHFSIEPSVSGSYYFSEKDSLFVASRFGEVTDFVISLANQIKGLYKKPNSNILYVLTTDELFEVNTETKEMTSLKKLPVSVEELKETPSSVKLFQNYPNPFNPTTTISFELDKPSEITLTVFDALGRTVSVLVDEQRNSGLHEVSFDASQLSSGIYFYRLETGDFVHTKTLTLIK